MSTKAWIPKRRTSGMTGSIGRGEKMSRLTLQLLCPLLVQSHGLEIPATMGMLMEGLIARAASSHHDWIRGQAGHCTST